MISADEKESYTTEDPLSVTAALVRAKTALESFTVKLIGEVSELNNKPGYKAVYFTVKDEQASLPCMMWLNRYHTCNVKIQLGMLVEITGRFTLYTPKGRMNFDVFSLSLAGEGNLRLRVANLAKKLQLEGLMQAENKLAIPLFPQVIGLVTSPRGAAVHDVLRTLRRRFPLARVLFAGVAVEGERAAVGLIQALRTVQENGAELCLLVRGGGSFEDLMPFNDEALARAIAALSIPVVTGIGHEPDTSIADMVADLRASTPTAAAEAVSPSFEALEEVLTSRSTTLHTLLSRQLERQVAALDRYAARSLFADPNTLFASEAQTIDLIGEQLHRIIPLNIERDYMRVERYGDRITAKGTTLLERFQSALSLRASRLHDLSPLVVLGRGYSIVRNRSGQVLKSVSETRYDDRVMVDLRDGRLICKIEGIEETEILVLEEDHD